MTNLPLIGLGAGVAGWALENIALDCARYSVAFGEHKVPFLPVYAAGGVAIALIAPHIEEHSPLARAAIYGLALSGIELAAGTIDRGLGASRNTWYYGPNGASVDLKHAVLWGGLGLAAEQVIKRLP